MSDTETGADLVVQAYTLRLRLWALWASLVAWCGGVGVCLGAWALQSAQPHWAILWFALSLVAALVLGGLLAYGPSLLTVQVIRRDNRWTIA